MKLFSLLRHLQRFFPDFFPSCYTEKRLNLRKLYSDIERKNDEDILAPSISSVLISKKIDDELSPLSFVQSFLESFKNKLTNFNSSSN